jgi:Uma2 family endonuclease
MTAPRSTTTVEAVSGRLLGGSSLRIPMSFDDFVALGETKHHEWYDGMCIVNPPTRRHAVAGKILGRLLDDHCPEGLTVLAEWGWSTTSGQFEPDLMVFPTDVPDRVILESVPPQLIVEILSPSTRTDDRIVKLAKYGAEGLPWYWIVDLDALTLEVLQNVDGILVEVQTIRAGEPAETIGPFPVPIDPASLGYEGRTR